MQKLHSSKWTLYPFSGMACCYPCFLLACGVWNVGRAKHDDKAEEERVFAIAPLPHKKTILLPSTFFCWQKDTTDHLLCDQFFRVLIFAKADNYDVYVDRLLAS